MTSLIKLHMAIAGCLAQKYLHASQLAELGDRSITSFPFEIAAPKNCLSPLAVF